MAEWVKFKLKIRPPRAKKSGSLNIKGMKNRKGRDEIIPGGKDYPGMAREGNRPKRLEWHEEGDDLLLHLDINYGQAVAIQAQGFYDATILTAQEAGIMKQSVFGIESGVSN